MPGSVADVVGHVDGNDHGELDESAHGAVLEMPCCLEYHFVETSFLYGVAVLSTGGEEVAYDPYRSLIVVINEIFTYEVAVLGKGLARARVHI